MTRNTIFSLVLGLLITLLAGSGYYIWALNNRVNDAETMVEEYRQELLADIYVLSHEMDTGTNKLQTAIADVDAALKSWQAEAKNNFDAARVYDAVSPAVVRITDGISTVGSGFFYDAAGHVITAYHVVDGLAPIYVMMQDGRTSKAELLAFSTENDVAVLFLEKNPGINPVVMADSSNVKIGEPVIAIGSPGDGDNPLGLRDTLTSGLVSQLNRFVDTEGNSVSGCIQFDAAVNFGNSGCALFNASGEVVGLVIARINPSIGDGINWAVSSNRVKKVADSLISTGTFVFPWVGIGITDLNPIAVEELGLLSANGVHVTTIYDNSPASAYGIMMNDIIVSLGERDVRDVDELVSFLVDYHAPGEEVGFHLLRNGEPMTITVRLGER